MICNLIYMYTYIFFYLQGKHVPYFSLSLALKICINPSQFQYTFRRDCPILSISTNLPALIHVILHISLEPFYNWCVFTVLFLRGQ